MPATRKDALHPALAEISSGCLAVRARIVARWISALYDHLLEGQGLSVAQLNVLGAVGALGSATPSRIGAVLSMERSTVSRNLVPLLEAGWLAAESTEAGRIRSVELTAAGLKAIERILPAWRKAQAQAEQALGEPGVAALHKLGAALRPAAAVKSRAR